ncbi:MAG TPA: polymer-forming cytoskeletal protein [Candidatus Acidoferrum sp.]|nr:polymer-forming cytoskeletal protein [Candidatus Acidoferrum sp.]
MWKKEDAKPEAVSSNPPSTPSPASSFSPPPASAPSFSGALPTSSRAAACISQGIKIKGELTGSEDLFVDGLVEGKLSLTTNSSLTVGPNGHVKADVSAREVIVRGKIEGKVTGRDKVQLWSTGQVIGEVQTDRLAIEDGAFLRGRVEAGKQPGKTSEIKASAAAAGTKPGEIPSVSSGTAAD